MRDSQPPPPEDEAWRGDNPSTTEEQPQNIPPPPTYYPPVYPPPVYPPSPTPYRFPQRGYSPSAPHSVDLPPPIVPVEEIYTETHPRRNWLRIPIERPIVTSITLVVLAGIYVPMFFSDDIALAFFNFGQKDNRLIVAGEWWRLLTSTLLHGYPFHPHILLNGFALYMIGNDLEAFFGRRRFFTIYWVSALGGSVTSFAFSPLRGLGASGAIFGLIGALAVYFGLHRNLFGKLGQAQFWNIIFVIVLNVGFGLSQILPIDNSAHIGGLIAGAAIGYVLCPRYALSNWHYPNARNLRNTNQGTLVWVAATLITLDVIFAFFVALLLYQRGIWQL